MSTTMKIKIKNAKSFLASSQDILIIHTIVHILINVHFLHSELWSASCSL